MMSSVQHFRTVPWSVQAIRDAAFQQSAIVIFTTVLQSAIVTRMGQVRHISGSGRSGGFSLKSRELSSASQVHAVSPCKHFQSRFWKVWRLFAQVTRALKREPAPCSFSMQAFPKVDSGKSGGSSLKSREFCSASRVHVHFPCLRSQKSILENLAAFRSSHESSDARAGTMSFLHASIPKVDSGRSGGFSLKSQELWSAPIFPEPKEE